MNEKQKALAHARRASRQAQLSWRRRDEAILRAAEFASYREVGEAVGLSKPRVAKIVADAKFDEEVRARFERARRG